MTKTDYVLAKPYFDGLKWHERLGEAFDTGKLDEALVEKLVNKGHLMTPKAYQASRNPEAARIQDEVEASQGQLQGLYDLLPGVTTPEGAAAAIKALQGRVPSGQEQQKAEAGVKLLDDLKKLFPKAKNVTELVAAVTDAQAKAAKPEDVAALADYRTVVGELLPAKFPSRQALLDNGYYTLEAVQGATDEALSALDGIAEGKLAEIRKAAPHTPAQGE